MKTLSMLGCCACLASTAGVAQELRLDHESSAVVRQIFSIGGGIKLPKSFKFTHFSHLHSSDAKAGSKVLVRLDFVGDDKEVTKVFVDSIGFSKADWETQGANFGRGCREVFSPLLDTAWSKRLTLGPNESIEAIHSCWHIDILNKAPKPSERLTAYGDLLRVPTSDTHQYRYCLLLELANEGFGAVFVMGGTVKISGTEPILRYLLSEFDMTDDR
jgi:hypothetical protein